MKNRPWSANRIHILTNLVSILLCALVPAGCHNGGPVGGEREWILVEADQTTHPDARCGDGSPYTWAYREGPGDGLLLFFQGGGACFSRRTCWDEEMSFDGGGRLVYSMDNSLSTPPYPESDIFDSGDLENPFWNYDVVYFPYCTGDMGVGTSFQTWRHKGETYDTYFHGSHNVRAALDWVEEPRSDPGRLVIAGTSAGGYAAMSVIERLVGLFPGREIPFVTDGALGIHAPLLLPVVESAWEPEWPSFCLDEEGCNRCETLGDAIDQGLTHYPHVRAAQLSFRQDMIQSAFAFAAQTDGIPAYGIRWIFGLPPFDEQVSEAVQARGQVCPDCRFYLPAGGCHVLLQSPMWTETEIEGWSPRDWVKAFLWGEAESLIGTGEVTIEPYPVDPDQVWVPCDCPDDSGACLGADIG